jgi:bacterioferritin (cytochrome b1)
MIQLLNKDLAGEYQAIISYVVYSQVMTGAAYTDIDVPRSKEPSDRKIAETK